MVAQQPSDEAMIYGWFVNTEHLSTAGAAGGLANLEEESGLDPNAYNAGENAHGIAQWEGGRWPALQAYAASVGLSPSDLRAQLGYLGQELNGPYRSVLNALRTATDPATAARIWDVGPGGVNSGTGFENSSGSTTADRVAKAQTIYQQIKAGQLTGSSAAFASSSTGSKVTPPPQPLPGSFTTKLTATQRAAIINWLLANKSAINSAAGLGGNLVGSRSDLEALPDMQLITMERAAIAATSGNASPGQIIGGIGGELANGVLGPVIAVVVKVAFTIAGLGLVLVGASAAAHDTGGTA